MTLMTDGSQARKTGSEKELVLVRAVISGVPTYYLLALQDIDSFGDADAANIKAAVDDVFENKLKISKEQYTHLVIATTADGASVNFGKYNGFLTRLKEDNRPWLLDIHCVAHRLELAIKSSIMKYQEFVKIEDYMSALYYFFKRSGKFKRHFNNAAKSFDITVYNFPKVTSTRFINHHNF